MSEVGPAHDHDHDQEHGEGHGAVAVAGPGPIAQSVAVGFRAIYAATLLLAVVWGVSNAHQIAPDSQAVVFRFGRAVRTQGAGLLLALPRPLETVRLLPGPDRQLTQQVAALPSADSITPEPAGNDPDGGSTPANAAPYLTGDGNVVLLDARLIYRITDPRAFMLAKDRFAPALDRLFRAAAVQAAAARHLNDFLAVRSGADGAAEAGVAELRAEVRDALLRSVNRRLEALAAAGQGLGAEVDRIDTTAGLPAEAKVAFDAVLTATQEAERGVAAARTAAELRLQLAARDRDRMIAAADASATEQLSNAHASTARIIALETQQTALTRETLVLQAYRTQLAELMRRVGAVTVVDTQGGSRVIVSGGTQ